MAAINRWYELKPFMTDSESAGLENMKKILGHVEKFIFLIQRSQDRIRIYIKIPESQRATIADLDGIEVNVVESPDLGGLGHYREYFTKRHCAYLVAGKDLMPTSPYHTLGNVVGGPAYVALYARRTHSARQINTFIRSLAEGRNPESIMDGIMGYVPVASGTSARAPTELQKRKMAAAKSKSAGALFYAKMIVGATTGADADSIFGMFPSNAFETKRIARRNIRRALSKRLQPPILGSSRMLVLNEDEIVSFLRLPSNMDIRVERFVLGRVQSDASGTIEAQFFAGAGTGVPDSDDQHPLDMPQDMPQAAFRPAQQETPQPAASDMPHAGSDAASAADAAQPGPDVHAGPDSEEDMLNYLLGRTAAQNPPAAKPSAITTDAAVPAGTQDLRAGKPEELHYRITPLDAFIIHMLYFTRNGFSKEEIIDTVSTSMIFGKDVKEMVIESMGSLFSNEYITRYHPTDEELEQGVGLKNYVIGKEAVSGYLSQIMLSDFDKLDIRMKLIFRLAAGSMNMHKFCMCGGLDLPDLTVIEPILTGSKPVHFDDMKWNENSRISMDVIGPRTDIAHSVLKYRRLNPGGLVWFVCFNSGTMMRLEDAIREAFPRSKKFLVDVVNPKAVPDWSKPAPEPNMIAGPEYAVKIKTMEKILGGFTRLNQPVKKPAKRRSRPAAARPAGALAKTSTSASAKTSAKASSSGMSKEPAKSDKTE